jgi:hypothetical protein
MPIKGMPIMGKVRTAGVAVRPRLKAAALAGKQARCALPSAECPRTVIVSIHQRSMLRLVSARRCRK